MACSGNSSRSAVTRPYLRGRGRRKFPHQLVEGVDEAGHQVGELGALLDGEGTHQLGDDVRAALVDTVMEPTAGLGGLDHDDSTVVGPSGPFGKGRLEEALH